MATGIVRRQGISRHGMDLVLTEQSGFSTWRVKNCVMMTSSNGNIFRIPGHLCGEFTGPGEFPAQRSVMRGFDVFFDLCLNKGLSKQPWGWWFETPAWSLWRQRNECMFSRCCDLLLLYTPLQRNWKGVYWFHLVCPFTCLNSCPFSVGCSVVGYQQTE